jgi:prepilin-type N-terminal cleavage/methylation domain-containing protein
MSRSVRKGSDSGFSVIELSVATIIFSIVVVGVLGLFDSAGKFNKSQLQASEMQQSLRAVLLEIERNVRMAGVGDLPVTQSVLVADPVTGTSYNNVPSGFGFADWGGGPVHPVRPGTDVIEIRGVIRSPLFALTSAGCFPCVGATDTVVIPAVSPYGVANNSAAEFQTLQSVLGSGGQHLFIVSSQHPDTSVGGTLHNVGMAGAITIDTVPAQARVVMNFTDSSAQKFNGSVPYGGSAAIALDTNIRGGILDDIVYFIDNTRTDHPALCMGLLKGVSPRTFQFFPISEEIEDLQVAYGVDGLDGTAPDGSVQDLYSPLAGKDEWAANVAGEPGITYASFFAATGPRLRAILLAVVSKAAQSDVAYKGRPFASGIFPLDSAAVPVSSQATNRKAIAMRVNLRNFNGGS